jgi:hypothetical protein
LTTVEVVHGKEPDIDRELCDILYGAWIDFAMARSDESGISSTPVCGRAI